MNAVQSSLVELRHFARIVGYGVIVLALLAYALAAFLWSLGQTPSAVVVAVFGYVLLRSRRTIAHSLTVRRHASRPQYAAALAQFSQTTDEPAVSDEHPVDDNNERNTT